MHPLGLFDRISARTWEIKIGSCRILVEFDAARHCSYIGYFGDTGEGAEREWDCSDFDKDESHQIMREILWYALQKADKHELLKIEHRLPPKLLEKVRNNFIFE